MKPVTWIQSLLFCCCAGIGLLRVANAQESRFPSRQAAVDSLLNPPLMQQAENILRFGKTVLDVGTLTEDDAPQTYRFTYTNVSSEPVVITRVRTTCGCAVAEARTGKVMPGETQTIALTYNPRNHPGTIDTNAFVYLSTSDKTPVARLTLTGNVLPGADEWARYPYAMGKLRLKQNRLTFREVAAGKQPSERILCGNSGDTPLRLSALILPKFATFRTEPEVIPPGGEADIVVTIDASLIPAGRGKAFTFPILIEGVDARPSDRTLNINVNCIKSNE